MRDYGGYLQMVLKRSQVNGALAAVDDFYIRCGLGPADAKRAEVPVAALRALSERAQIRYLWAVQACGSACRSGAGVGAVNSTTSPVAVTTLASNQQQFSEATQRNYLTIAPDGSSSATFSGVVTTSALNLTAGGPIPSAINWIRQSDGAVVAELVSDASGT